MRRGRRDSVYVGSVSGKWAFDDEFSPMVSIPIAVSLTIVVYEAARSLSQVYHYAQFAFAFGLVDLLEGNS